MNVNEYCDDLFGADVCNNCITEEGYICFIGPTGPVCRF